MNMLIFSILFLSFTILLSMSRAIKGPRASDRLIAINVICTKTIVLILIVSFVFKESYFVDVTFVYALIGFISSIIISRYVRNHGDRNI